MDGRDADVDTGAGWRSWITFHPTTSKHRNNQSRRESLKERLHVRDWNVRPHAVVVK
jgi:hypothetical protein